MVQIKTVASVAVAVSSIAPVLAYDAVDVSLDAREPFLGSKHIKKWLGRGKHGHHGHHHHNAAAATPTEGGEDPSAAPVSGREFDDLDLFVRDPFLGSNHIKKWLGRGKHGHHGHHASAPVDAPPAGGEDPSVSGREFEDALDYFAREPLLGSNHIKKWLGRGKHAHGHHGHHHHEAAADVPPAGGEDPSAAPVSGRDLGLEEREPFLGSNHVKKWLGHGKHGHGHHGHHAAAPAEEAPVDTAVGARDDIDELLELLARDMMMDELDY